MENKKHILSKSTYMRGLKCQKSLWLNKYHKELRDEMTDAQRRVFETGTNVGELAQQIFPGGLDATPEEFWDYRKSIQKTSEWISTGAEVIYEAAFQYDQVLAALDIFIQKDGKSKAFEVKSSTKVKPEHIQDAALQYYVMNKSGFAPDNFYIVHINNEYLRKGELEVKKLFKAESVIKQIKELQPKVEEAIKQSKFTLAVKQMPSKRIGVHCNKPYDCDFIGFCWQDIPEYSVFDITRLGAKVWDLYDKGIVNTSEVPEDFDLTDDQIIQVRADRTGDTIINNNNLSDFINGLSYPLFFMDFETFRPSVPKFDNALPYQQIPFQYSVHIQHSPDSEIEHLEFIAPPGSDPRYEFASALIKDIGTSGDVVVYNESFEKKRLEELAELYPELSDELLAINERVKDLMIPFINKDYYKPDMRGSYSIKKVLPSLVPELSYNGLDVANGDDASFVYESMYNTPNATENEVKLASLYKYCELDTLAMVKILDHLKKAIAE